MVMVKLLGRPALLADGVEFEGPRGKKSWGLLAYLAGSGAAIPRERLVRLLFPDADDGLAALRWNLAELRRITGQPQSFAGDPVALALGGDVRVDLQLLAAPVVRGHRADRPGRAAGRAVIERLERGLQVYRTQPAAS